MGPRPEVFPARPRKILAVAGTIPTIPGLSGVGPQSPILLKLRSRSAGTATASYLLQSESIGISSTYGVEEGL
jgi:hypothetical protein